MGFYRAFAAAHGAGGGGPVQVLQHAQGERLALAGGQAAQRVHQLLVLLALFMRLCRVRAGIGPVDLAAFRVLVVAPERQAEAAPPLQVDHAPAQDAPEQRRPFGRWLVGVVQHAQQRVLHRVHGVFALAQAGLGEAERARANTGQERLQRRRQGIGLGARGDRAAHQHRVRFLARGHHRQRVSAASVDAGSAPGSAHGYDGATKTEQERCR